MKFELIAWKVCSKCKEEKPETEFALRSDRAVRSYHSLQRKPECRKCSYKSYVIPFREKNKIYFAEYNKTYMSKYKNKQKVRSKYNKKISNNLSDAYIKGRLNSDYGLRFNEIPDELVDVRRKMVQSYRLLKKLKEVKRNETKVEI
jgi:hypothetical protein